MSTIVTRAGKGSPLTHNEVDANFNNLNSDKYQSGDSPTFVTVNATTVDATNVEVTNVKAKDGTAAIVISDTSGNVGIGTTSPLRRLDIAGGGFAFTESGGASRSIHWGDTTNIYPVTIGSNATTGNCFLTFNTNTFGNSASERMRIDSSGNVGIGGTADAFAKFKITGTLPTSSTITVADYSSGTIPSGTTSSAYGYYSALGTQAASFTLTSLIHNYVNPATFGAGSTVSNQYGYYAESTLTGATSNFGFYSNIASGSNRWNFYAAGTARNYFAGSTGIGVAPDFALHVYGAGSTSNNYANGAASGATLSLQDSGSGSGNGGQILFGSFFGVNAGIKSLLTNGTGPAGDMVFQTRGTSGDVLERMRIDSAGNVVVNTAAVATNATNGFLYVPTCAGTPTGTPSSFTGRAPIVVDTTNNKLYFYSGGQWRDAGP